MSIVATSLRRGMPIIFQGEPCRVIEFHHHTPGNLRAMVHAKLRKLKTGSTVEHRFRASDTIEEAHLELTTAPLGAAIRVLETLADGWRRAAVAAEPGA